MGLTAVRYFRDKLAMRERARKGRHPVPIVTFSTDRSSRISLGSQSLAVKPARKSVMHEEDSLPDPVMALAGPARRSQSFYLLEEFVPGVVYHVDRWFPSAVLLAEAQRLWHAPLRCLLSGSLAHGQLVTKNSERQ